MTPQGTVSYTYDAAGRRTTMTVTGQPTVSYTYDATDRLTQLQQGTSTVTVAYDSAGRRTSLTLPNGVTTAYAYDAASRLTGLIYTYGQTTLGTLTYSYDATGNRTVVGGTWARTGLPQAVTAATYNVNNQQVAFNGQPLTFDLNGNLTSDGANTYTWNARDQLVAITGAGLTASFAYDSAGRRLRKTINGTQTDVLYDGANPVQELNGVTVVANVLAGLAVDEYFTRTDPAGASHLLTDALGSTVALADPAGSVATTYTYEPFGATAASGAPTGNAVDYTGRDDDRTGLKYYRARYYHPGLPRFISEDPLYRFAHLGGCSSLGATSQRFNLYSYVENNPLGFTDPLGLEKRNCLGDYFTKCLPDCAIVPGLTTAITTAGNVTANYYAAKAFVYAASKNLIYPLRSSVYRGFANIATKASPVAALLGLNYCIYSCLYEEAKCERLF